MRTHFTGKPNLPPVVKQMREWQNDLNERLKGREIPPKYWEFPELEKGNIHKNHCAYCIDIYCDQTRNDSNKSKLNLSTNCAMTSCKYGCGARYHVCKTSEHLLICTIGDVENEYNKMYQGVSGEQRRSSGASLSSASFWSDKYFSDSFNKTNEKRKSLKRTENISKLFAPKHFQTIGDWLEGPKERANTNINSKMKTNPPEPPVVETLERNQLNKGMMVNLSFTNESKHTAKATEVYSFTCSQMFRRDQFEWHSKNVHDDIFGGLHDWVEHRCPLASYGCGFSVRRLHPKANHNLSNQGNYRCLSLIYSPLLESIGVSITDNTPVEDTMRNELLMLPCEILYQIFHHIDSFRYEIQKYQACISMDIKISIIRITK